ncbi:MAG TPA: hypothetical protein VFA10_01400 [Ktedonobacteraceae bacterium]|nr:hypothetical protein [Ktedonobacteraceae bacterium]
MGDQSSQLSLYHRQVNGFKKPEEDPLQASVSDPLAPPRDQTDADTTPGPVSTLVIRLPSGVMKSS